jgi:hypothetical protein
MLGETSDFGAIDLLGVLGVNALGSHMACANPTLRVGMFGMKDKTGDVPAYLDARFILGTVATIVGQFSGEYTMIRRAANDLATGALGSYVATETCRRAALKRIEQAQTPPAGDVAAITQDAPGRAGAKRGGAGPAGGQKMGADAEATGYDW